MAKRKHKRVSPRRRHVGSPPATHEESFRHDIADTRTAIHDANEYLKLVDSDPAYACTHAFEALTDSWVGVSAGATELAALPYGSEAHRRYAPEHSSVRSAALSTHLKFKRLCLKTRRD